ncbi:tetratricopeptide repeat protein [Psychrobacter sp. HII-4]|uniref:tetratricopeptide repeat protein n=1 Tax=Psychrobacter sp. HII-4 TaxID=1569264 RepID=UPI00191A4E6D|nr:tetratricopeptide repeat protein [Psychrobacter sp. HII-4]
MRAKTTIKHKLMSFAVALGLTLSAQYTQAASLPVLDIETMALQGNVQAQYDIGAIYLEGKIVEKDYDKALKWLLKAANQGHPLAQYNLGWVYEDGMGVPQDYNKSTGWFQKSAEQGFVDAQTSIGVRYVKGQGVPQNYAKGLE